MATQRVQLTVTAQRFFDDAQNKREAVRVWSLPWKLPYWIEKWDAQNGQGKVWVKVPKIPANSSVDLYVYYGNPSAVSESDPEQVFDLYDDFEGSSVDTTKWTLVEEGSTSITVSDSILDIKTSIGAANKIYLATQRTFTQPLVVEARVMLKSSYTVHLELSSSQTSEQAPLVRLELKYRSGYPTRIVSNDGNSVVSSELATITGNEWHQVGIKTDGNIHIGYWDGNTASITQTNAFSGYVMIFQKSAYDASMETLIDWVRVRKYAEQEPTIVVGEEESSDISGWLYRRKITITNPNNYDLEHFQVAIDLDGSNFDFIKANADGSDIRIAYASARYSLPYYIETWDTSTPQAVIWIGIDSETRFFVELNPNNTTDESDPSVMSLPEATNYTLNKFERYAGGG